MFDTICLETLVLVGLRTARPPPLPPSCVCACVPPAPESRELCSDAHISVATLHVLLCEWLGRQFRAALAGMRAVNAALPATHVGSPRQSAANGWLCLCACVLVCLCACVLVLVLCLCCACVVLVLVCVWSCFLVRVFTCACLLACACVFVYLFAWGVVCV